MADAAAPATAYADAPSEPPAIMAPYHPVALPPGWSPASLADSPATEEPDLVLLENPGTASSAPSVSSGSLPALAAAPAAGSDSLIEAPPPPATASAASSSASSSADYDPAPPSLSQGGGPLKRSASKEGYTPTSIVDFEIKPSGRQGKRHRTGFYLLRDAESTHEWWVPVEEMHPDWQCLVDRFEADRRIDAAIEDEPSGPTRSSTRAGRGFNPKFFKTGEFEVDLYQGEEPEEVAKARANCQGKLEAVSCNPSTQVLIGGLTWCSG